MVTPPPQRSSCGGRLQQQQQQYGVVTPPSVGPPYGHNSPSTRLSFSGTTPGSSGSFGAMLQAGGGTPVGIGQQHRPPLSSPLMDGHGSLSHGSMVPYRSSSSSLTPASMSGASIQAATHKSVQAAAGVTRLMQQCTHMLKERMFPHEQQGAMQRHSQPGATPDTAMKALGPVLEGVLGQLTEEYERRLLTKDHELGKAQEAQRRAEEKCNRLQVSRGLSGVCVLQLLANNALGVHCVLEKGQLDTASKSDNRQVELCLVYRPNTSMHLSHDACLQVQYEQLQREVDERSQAAAKASEESRAADAAALQQQLDQARAQLAQTEAELQQAKAALSSAGSEHLDAYHALQHETMMLRTRLGELLPVEEKYKAVVLENRELYNTVQDLRGNIRVFCRCAQLCAC